MRDRFNSEMAAKKLGIVPGQQRLFKQILHILKSAGMLHS